MAEWMIAGMLIGGAFGLFAGLSFRDGDTKRRGESTIDRHVREWFEAYGPLHVDGIDRDSGARLVQTPRDIMTARQLVWDITRAAKRCRSVTIYDRHGEALVDLRKPPQIVRNAGPEMQHAG